MNSTGNRVLIALGIVTAAAAAILNAAVVPLIVVAAACLMTAVERSNPGRNWPSVKGWWVRCAILNVIQVAVVFLAGWLWDGWMMRHRLLSAEGLGAFWGAMVGYLAITFVFYWWHYFRHKFDFLWLTLHQVHHAPQRIEVITSFYKHPFELFSNGLIVSAILYLGVGCNAEQAAGALLLSGLAELFYHWNVKTPYWLGFIIQRPESHCVHHQAGKHRSNYGDLPLWDWMFGTLDNPRNFDAQCGFGEQEHELGKMLLCKDVFAGQLQKTAPSDKRGGVRMAAFFILGVGLLQMAGDLLQLPAVKGLGAATMISPAPKVFTAHKGLETYSAQFILQWKSRDGQSKHRIITPEVYGKVLGPYQRRNVYGAVLSYGPVLATDPSGQGMFRSVSGFALCGKAPLLREIDIDPTTIDGSVTVRYIPPPTVNMGDLPRELEVKCQ